MKKRVGFFLAIATTLLLGSCAVTDMSHETDFNQYHTFGWSTATVNVDNPIYKSGLISKNIRKNVKDQFEKHGLVYTAKDPDLLVSYETFTKEKQQMYSNYYGGYPYMYGMYYRGFPMMWGYPYMPYGGYGGPANRYFTEGTLIIDITDARTNEQVWRGAVKGNVSDVKVLSKSIDKGVKAIMKKYPGNVDPNRQQINTGKKVS